MSERLLAELAEAGDALVGALDRDDIHEIEATLARFRMAVEAARISGMRKPQPELRELAARAFSAADAARVRINYLADRTRRQLDRLAVAGRTRPALAYGRDGRLR